MNGYDDLNESKDEFVEEKVKIEGSFYEVHNSSYKEQEVRAKKKSAIKTYIALILISSIISSSAAYGALYFKFSSELDKKAGNEKVVSEVSKNNNDVVLNGLLKTSLTKGSPVTQIAKKVGPSVVGITMTYVDPDVSFFGQQGGSKSEGSGIILSQDGYIMTNYHVVSYADPKGGLNNNTTLEVFLPDKRQVKGKFIGGDESKDLAVIKIDLNNLPVAELGDSTQLEVGELAVAIGNPLGMEFAGSVTVGVVSALNRSIDTQDDSMKLIQTDAAINPGNSGGALVNSQGEVIGINSAKISSSGIEGLGFAIPISDAKPIIDQLMMFGYIKGKPFIGISGIEITDILSSQYNVPVGIYVKDITPGSGAANAGIQKADVLVSLAGKDVKTLKDLDNIKRSYKAGDTVKAVVVRDGSKVELSLTFSEDR
jgi:serine protease Do